MKKGKEEKMRIDIQNWKTKMNKKMGKREKGKKPSKAYFA